MPTLRFVSRSNSGRPAKRQRTKPEPPFHSPIPDQTISLPSGVSGSQKNDKVDPIVRESSPASTAVSNISGSAQPNENETATPSPSSHSLDLLVCAALSARGTVSSDAATAGSSSIQDGHNNDKSSPGTTATLAASSPKITAPAAVFHLGPNDVLLGGPNASSRRRASQRIGNRRYRVTVEWNLSKYMAIGSHPFGKKKWKQRKMIDEVVTCITRDCVPPGRFYEWNASKNMYVPLDKDEEVARCVRRTFDAAASFPHHQTLKGLTATYGLPQTPSPTEHGPGKRNRTAQNVTSTGGACEGLACTSRLQCSNTAEMAQGATRINIMSITKNDVLCVSKDRSEPPQILSLYANNIGNNRMMVLITLHMARYRQAVDANDDKAKQHVVDSVLQATRISGCCQPVRFLQAVDIHKSASFKVLSDPRDQVEQLFQAATENTAPTNCISPSTTTSAPASNSTCVAADGHISSLKVSSDRRRKLAQAESAAGAQGALNDLPTLPQELSGAFPVPAYANVRARNSSTCTTPVLGSALAEAKLKARAVRRAVESIGLVKGGSEKKEKLAAAATASPYMPLSVLPQDDAPSKPVGSSRRSPFSPAMHGKASRPTKMVYTCPYPATNIPVRLTATTGSAARVSFETSPRGSSGNSAHVIGSPSKIRRVSILRPPKHSSRSSAVTNGSSAAHEGTMPVPVRPPDAGGPPTSCESGSVRRVSNSPSEMMPAAESKSREQYFDVLSDVVGGMMMMANSQSKRVGLETARSAA